ncbi:hypothetical protein SCHPADRAFT_687362 [Schizopora paradoxa]|uniref:Uncharacterized protein n=1 Tax=Schizopora paradoxa TaxID=27342 RepID=A0A0H2R5C2_9AGAM|nr:hypothetical protein SCHPADRAFT_687362 [Schizopora paradoxa]
MAPTTGDNRRRGSTTSASHNHHHQLREDDEHRGVDGGSSQKTTTTAQAQAISTPRRSSLLSEVGSLVSVASDSSVGSTSAGQCVKLQLPSRHPNWRPASASSTSTSTGGAGAGARSTSPPPASLSSLSSRRGTGAGRVRGLGPLSRFEPPEREPEVSSPRTGASIVAVEQQGGGERSIGEEVLKEQRKDEKESGRAGASLLSLSFSCRG